MWVSMAAANALALRYQVIAIHKTDVIFIVSLLFLNKIILMWPQLASKSISRNRLIVLKCCCDITSSQLSVTMYGRLLFLLNATIYQITIELIVLFMFGATGWYKYFSICTLVLNCSWSRRIWQSEEWFLFFVYLTKYIHIYIIYFNCVLLSPPI